ncbi:hypothetical protein [Thalassotalea euphylliae]|uniref:Uncharacterized protein n=1 Tax=Thalassotalea euphylliae TaxID=1655234 RepID=A0A3E0U183_9GAMM|nr:hypothetical protein [Thalassotalea euphylliae]REL29985.1 hypothetical protein DXX94_04285 [Thalassotalea euphylliae]
MEALTVHDAVQLIRLNEDAISTQFQVWLTITFSTIVATFAGRSLLTRKTKWLVTLLYLLASMATLSSSIYLAESNARIVSTVEGLSSLFSPPIFAGTAYLSLFIAGITTTVYFIHMKIGELLQAPT